MLNIGIDIDGVITNIESCIIDYGTKYCYEHNLDYTINLNEYYEGKIFNLPDDIVEKIWNKYLGEYAQNEQPRKFAAEVISKLKENNNIYIITARNEVGLPKELYGTMQTLVKEWLTKYNIQYNKLIFTSEDKLETCLKNNIDIMIEDSPKNILEISNKIPVICFNNDYNTKIYGNNIIRAYSWYDIARIVRDWKH